MKAITGKIRYMRALDNLVNEKVFLNLLDTMGRCNEIFPADKSRATDKRTITF